MPPGATRCGPGLSTRTIRHGRLLEQHADWVWTVIDPVAPEADAVGAALIARLTACAMAADRYAEIFAAHRWNVPAQFNIAQACCARWANERSRFALYWEDESGATAALHVLRPAAAGEPAVECARGAGHRPRRQDRAHPSATAGNRRRASGRVPAGRRGRPVVVPVRSGSAVLSADRFRRQNRFRRSAVAPQSRARARRMSRRRARRGRRRRGRSMGHALRVAAAAGVVRISCP